MSALLRSGPWSVRLARHRSVLSWFASLATRRWRPAALTAVLLLVSGGLAVTAAAGSDAGRLVARPVATSGGPAGGVGSAGTGYASGVAGGPGDLAVAGPGGGSGPVGPAGAATPGAPAAQVAGGAQVTGGAVPTTTVPALAVSGPVPASGRGTLRYDDRAGVTLGRSGGVQRYRVAVENGSGEDVRDFSDQVQAALAGPGSWVDGGGLRLRRVPGNAPYDFTVQLVTRNTAARLCRAGGVDIRVGGVPYTSCRAPGKVIVNLDRWRLSVAHFVRAGVPLERYRTYVVNHEVGHQLGHRHEDCPGPGRPAPVMQQQSLFLGGCTANPWPYLNGRRYAGPAR
ncbi:DUF3152 domain-containing protein [Micromonospora rifamycinica]|uniref:Uncharacterized protein n=1 Tax=Micromonospora rifamycinica TaxID=291594 RepID=A0A120F7D6_9ACTN|nr:DUF3152 domain-containing protein [Micromonospora rifamycinica]KWV30037.1 hypothetical protein AWV63_25215 [Micromonospora rifamycinica]SCG78488.1 Protein of unknown function [Micromonospora rifamycinica]